MDKNPPNRLEEVLDEVVWNMMQTLNDKGVEPNEAMMIMQRIGHFALSGEFEDFYSGFSYEKDHPDFKEWVKAVINI